MKSLFKKQLLEALLASLLALIVALCFLWSQPRLHVTTHLGDDRGVLLVALLWTLLGAALGFVGFVLEERRGTRAYWIHRGGGERLAFAAKVAADLVAMGVALLLLIALDAWAVSWSWDAGTEVFSRYFELLVAGLAGVVAHAVGTFAAQLRRSLYVRALFVALALPGLFLWLVYWRWSFFFGRLPAEPALASFVVLVPSVIYALASRAFREGADPDRPFTPRTRIACALLAVLLALPCVLVGVASVQTMSISMALENQPALFHDESVPARVSALDLTLAEKPAGITAAPIFELKHREPKQFDPEHYDYNIAWSEQPFELGARWRSVPFSLPRMTTTQGANLVLNSWLSARDGVVMVVAQSPRLNTWDSASGTELARSVMGKQGQFVQLLARPDGRRFSAKTALLDRTHEDGGALLFDASDHTIWRIEAESGTLRLVATGLPNNDLAVGLDAQIPRAWAQAHGSGAIVYRTEFLVVGEHGGRYQWNGEAFEAYVPPPEFVLRSQADAVRRVEVELADANVFAPNVRVLVPGTKQVLYEHQYQVEGSGWVRLAFACTLLRAPLTTALAFAKEGPVQPIAVYVLGDALLMGHARPWLLASNLLVSALVIAALLRRGALGMRLGWVALVALMGPAILFVPLLLEPLRAQRKPVRLAQPATKLVLQSS